MVVTPLELPEWLEFNTWRSGLKAHVISTTSGEGSTCTAVLYVDRRGRVKLPPNNPYLSVAFHSTATRPSGRTADWHRSATDVVDEMKTRGVVNQVYLPPQIVDVRPWSGRGFFVEVAYTYVVALPFDDALMDRGTRRGIDKAVKLGLTTERGTDVDRVFACLAETEARKGFSHGLGPDVLRAASAMVDRDHLRMYICLDAQGRVVSSNVVLHSPGATAIDWLHGTTSEGMSQGAGALLRRSVWADLADAGAVAIDLCGANIPSVASFKARWGADLRPTYGVRSYSARSAVRFGLEWLDSLRGSRTDFSGS